MFKDDDEEEESSFGATRYACMPSLVALQQMRNRLHLAHLGRKLMKWTAMATGRELRKIAIELDAVIRGFGEEMKNAFILLARARYFCPELNKIVLENIGTAASVLVVPTPKTVSAVKMVHYEISETGVLPYEHLGLEKGGQAIMEAKKAWLDLLKKMIKIMQLRTSFIMVEHANKNATKRMNILNKIILPKTSITATYILSELEELAREEFSRLKKIKEKKKRDSKKKHDHEEGHFCPICDKRTDKTKVEIGGEVGPAYFLEAKETKSDTEKKIVIPSVPPTVNLDNVTAANKTIIPPTTTTQSATETNVDSKLEFVRQRLANIIAISKDFIEMGVDSFDVNEFLNICEAAKIKIEQFFETEQPPSQGTPKINDQLSDLKSNLREIVDVTKEFKKEGFVSSSIDNFIKVCEKVDSKLVETQKKSPKEEKSKEIENFMSHIDDVMEMAQNYTAEGLLSIGVEEFLGSCSAIKAKIEGKPTPVQNVDEAKLDHLKEHVSELEDLTIGIKEKKISSSSVERFISSCKEFKRKIEEDREKLQARKTLKELSGHIEGTVSVCKEAQKEGLLGESVEDFLKSIGDMKSQLKDGDTEAVFDASEPTVLDTLKNHINNIIKSVAKLKSENLITVSVDKFLNSCEMTRAKIDLYQKYRPPDIEKRTIYPTCGKNCICDHNDENVCAKKSEECERCKEMTDDYPYMEMPAPCDSCSDNVKDKAISAACDFCSRPIEEDILLPEPSPDVSPEESHLCEVCEALKEKDVTEDEEKEAVVPVVDSSLGYFENKVRKITKVKRTQNPDGTIREEKETITVRKVKHDPTETSLLDDDDIEEGDVSFESLLDDDDDEKQIAMCSVPNENQRGFIYQKAKSELIFRVSPMVMPKLKQCISCNGFGLADNNSIANESLSVEIDFCSLYCNSNVVSSALSID